MEPIYHFVKTRAGEYHTGIPARDLTEEDLKALSQEQLAVVEASPLYREIEERPAEPERPAPRGQPSIMAPAPRGGER